MGGGGQEAGAPGGAAEGDVVLPAAGQGGGGQGGYHIGMLLANLVRDKVREWRLAGWPGVTRTSLDLLRH